VRAKNGMNLSVMSERDVKDMSKDVNGNSDQSK